MRVPRPFRRAPRRVRVVVVAWMAASLALPPIALAQPTLPAQQTLPDLGDPSLAYLSGAQERKLGGVLGERRGERACLICRPPGRQTPSAPVAVSRFDHAGGHEVRE